MSPDYFVNIINQSLPEPHASLLAGMLFGQKYSHMPGELYAALLRTGTLHVVALSGTNVSILMKIVQQTTAFLGRKLSAAAVLGTILGFLVLVGLDPPIVRATIMGAAGAILGFSGRRSWALLSLLFSGGVMLLVWPEWLYSLSFQLSFLATLGIILFDAPVALAHQPQQRNFFRSETPQHLFRQKKGAGSNIHSSKNLLAAAVLLAHKYFDNNVLYSFIPKRLTLFLNKIGARAKNSYLREVFIKVKNIFAGGLKTTLAAQVLITPVLVYNFGRLSLISPVANALGLWSVEFITWGGVFLVLGGAVFAPIGRVTGLVVWGLLEYFIKIVELMSKVPYGEIAL